MNRRRWWRVRQEKIKCRYKCAPHQMTYVVYTLLVCIACAVYKHCIAVAPLTIDNVCKENENVSREISPPFCMRYTHTHAHAHTCNAFSSLGTSSRSSRILVRHREHCSIVYHENEWTAASAWTAVEWIGNWIACSSSTFIWSHSLTHTYKLTRKRRERTLSFQFTSLHRFYPAGMTYDVYVG